MWIWFDCVCVCFFFWIGCLLTELGSNLNVMMEMWMVNCEWNFEFRDVDNYLAKISLSSCSETNCPKFATNSVEQGAFAASGGFGCCAPVDPTGLAKAGLGKKWPGGNPADTCIADCGCIADGGCNVIWFWNSKNKKQKENNSAKYQ